jgi:NAD(P)-dependent dehydrogenase (short-subunit alcohol dehydrogenase family)
MFGTVDILVCCTSQVIVGTVEELAASQTTLNLVREQFETNYYGPVNIIKAALPQMRKQKSGHVLVLSGIS